jgi:antibiotic biosynthesis monooxygenase (ABM) superfamily enzyme
MGKPPAIMAEVSQSMVDSSCQQCCAYPKEKPMSVLAVVKSDLRPEMAVAWAEYAKVNIPVLLTIPGLVEHRVYRTIAGSSFYVATYEFTDLVAYAAWRSHPESERIWVEAHTYLENISVELWGPSPVVPAPLRPE